MALRRVRRRGDKEKEDTRGERRLKVEEKERVRVYIGVVPTEDSIVCDLR